MSFTTNAGIVHEYKVNGKTIDFFLLSRILSALFTLLVNFIEIITGVADSSVKDGLCRFHVSLLALPHLLYLLNLLLSLAECYGSRKSSDGSKAVHFLSIAQHPFLILALNLLVALVVDWMYLSGWAPLTCAYHKMHLATLVTVLLILFIPCAVLLVILQVKNKRKQRRQRLQDSSRTVAVRRLLATRTRQQQIIDQSVTTLIKNQQREIYAAFLTGATLNLILYCPLLLLFLSHLLCLPFFSSAEQCNDFMWLAAYFDKLISLHALVDSISYLCGVNKANDLLHYHRAITDYRRQSTNL